MSRTSRVLVAETARAQDAVEVREASRVECIEPAERTTRPPPGLCEPVVELVVHGHDVRIADARRSSKPHLGCGGLRVRVDDRVASPLSTIPANPTPPNGTATAVRSDCTAGRRPTSELERQVRSSRREASKRPGAATLRSAAGGQVMSVRLRRELDPGRARGGAEAPRSHVERSKHVHGLSSRMSFENSTTPCASVSVRCACALPNGCTK